MKPRPKKVVIIGGGITGLSCAYALQENSLKQGVPIDCVLIESESRFGGKITTENVDGFIIEGGPDSFITQKPWGLDLCKRLGLTDRLIRTHPVEKAIYVLSCGQLVPLPAGFQLMIPGQITPFLTTPLISPSGKARMGLDLIIPRRDFHAQHDESIASFVRRRLGEEAVSQFAEPILAGIYAGDVEKLSLMATFPQFASLEQQYGSLIWGALMQRWDLSHRKKSTPAPQTEKPWSLFVTLKGGLSEMVNALIHHLEEHIVLTSCKKVTGVYPVASVAQKASQYAVCLEDETLVADSVVITVNATLASDWIKGWDAPLSERLKEIPYVSTATISLGFRGGEIKHPLNGFGFVVPRREGRKILAGTWTSTKFEGRAPQGCKLIRLFLGGGHQEEIVSLDDTALTALAMEEIHGILGITARPETTRIYRWYKGNPQYHIGHLDHIAQIEAAAAKHTGFFLAGSAYRGVGIPDCIHQGTETADRIIRLFSNG